MTNVTFQKNHSNRVAELKRYGPLELKKADMNWSTLSEVVEPSLSNSI